MKNLHDRERYITVQTPMTSELLHGLKIPKRVVKGLEKIYTPNELYDIAGCVREGCNINEFVPEHVTIWTSSHFRALEKNRNQLCKEVVNDEEEIEEGEFTCKNKKCQSKRCRFWTEQNRSADEGESLHIVCSICYTKFTINS